MEIFYTPFQMLHLKKYLWPFLDIYATTYITKYVMLGILKIWHKNREKGGQENLFYLKYVSHLSGRAFFLIWDATKIIIFKRTEKKAELKRSWNSRIKQKKKLCFEDLVSGAMVLLKFFFNFWIIRFSTILNAKI